MARRAMNALFLLPSGMVGGAERIAFNLAALLLEQGHHVTVYAMTRGRGVLWTQLEDQANFHYMASNAASERRGLLEFLARLPKLRRRGPFDLVYTSHVHVNALASLLVTVGLLSTRHLVSRESTRIFDRFRGFRRLVYRIAYGFYGRQDLLIFQTDEMRESLARNFRIPPGIAQEVIPNPVDLQWIDRLKAQPALENTADFEIVCCGRLIPLKRVSLLLQSLAAVRYRDWRLHIIGDGPDREALEQEADRLGIGERITFTGHIENPIAYLASADLGVLCSEIEGFPNVLLEMMASGTKCVISTPCTEAVRSLPGWRSWSRPTRQLSAPRSSVSWQSDRIAPLSIAATSSESARSKVSLKRCSAISPADRSARDSNSERRPLDREPAPT